MQPNLILEFVVATFAAGMIKIVARDGVSVELNSMSFGDFPNITETVLVTIHHDFS